MGFCPSCRTSIEIPNATFCPECGKRLIGSGYYNSRLSLTDKQHRLSQQHPNDKLESGIERKTAQEMSFSSQRVDVKKWKVFTAILLIMTVCLASGLYYYYTKYNVFYYTYYNQLRDEYEELTSKYNDLRSMYEAISQERYRINDWYALLRNSVNRRLALGDMGAKWFVMPGFNGAEKVINDVTGGWSDKANWNEYWDDIKKIYDWVLANVQCTNDPMYPLLPELLSGPIQEVQDYWRLPEETLAGRQGDCEDQATMLASMLLTYCDEQYTVWVIGLTGQSGGHMAVAFPVEGDKLTILDTAGHFYTGSEYGVLCAKDIRTAVNEWTKWIDQANPGAHLHLIFSHTELERFSSIDEFVDWVPSNGHKVVKLFADLDIIHFQYITIIGYSPIEINLYYINEGETSTMIDSIYINGVPVLSYSPIPILGGDFGILPSLCEPHVQKEGIINLINGVVDPSGNQLTHGVTIRITLHMTNGIEHRTLGYTL